MVTQFSDKCYLGKSDFIAQKTSSIGIIKEMLCNPVLLPNDLTL